MSNGDDRFYMFIERGTDPTVSGTDAPLHSFCSFEGNLYRKTGDGPNDWEIYPAAAPAGGSEVFAFNATGADASVTPVSIDLGPDTSEVGDRVIGWIIQQGASGCFNAIQFFETTITIAGHFQQTSGDLNGIDGVVFLSRSA